MSSNPFDVLLNQLGSVLDRNVAQSPRAREAAEQLDGRVLALALEGTPVTLYFRVEGGHVRIGTGHEGTVDASLSGTPLSLLTMIGPRAEERMRGAGIRISGEAEVAQRFRELLQHAQPDFEEELSRVIGDVAAHQVASIARGLFDWGRRAADSLSLNVAEYLQEEGRDVPSRTELEEFLEGVDRLREATDRLEARLGRLGTQAAGRA